MRKSKLSSTLAVCYFVVHEGDGCLDRMDATPPPRRHSGWPAGGGEGGGHIEVLVRHQAQLPARASNTYRAVEERLLHPACHTAPDDTAEREGRPRQAPRKGRGGGHSAAFYRVLDVTQPDELE